MISTCEFQLVLLKYPDPEAAIAEIGAAYTATQARESVRTRDCLNRAMTAEQSRQAWACLESLTDCSQLPRCVGPSYQANPTNRPALNSSARRHRRSKDHTTH